ncbi:MAG: DUF58 domain-containing protein [Desulfatitalea sp.]|nr:DUF58 domain-containing protein [Desulfatitalea sp.]
MPQRDSAHARFRQADEPLDGRVYTSLHQLLALQHKARGFSFLPRQPLHSLLAGRHAAKVRGRGLNFEEIRAYFPGDDIRTIDWKVTARTQKPHTRVFTEERERPALLVVDQRMDMFFGSQLYMKSVTAAEAAALGAWRILDQGDRVGALVFNDTQIVEIRPHRSRKNVMRILQNVVEMNRALGANQQMPANPEMLNQMLEAAGRLAGHDYLIAVISDFEGADDQTRGLMLRLSRHNDLIGVVIHDPSATDLPTMEDLVITDGQLQIELPLGNRKVRRKLAESAKSRIARLLAWQQEIRVPMLPVTTAQGVLEQIQHLLGYAPRKTGRRHG